MRNTTNIRLLPSGKHQARFKAPDATWRTLGTYATAKEAHQALASRITQVERPADAITFQDFAWQVFEHKSHTLKNSTLANHRTLLTKTLIPTFGNVLLTDIRPLSVDRWFWAFQGGQVNRTRAYSVLHNYLGYAVRWELLKSNPAMVEGGFSDRSAPRPTWETTDFLKLLDKADKDFNTVLLTAFTGHLRAGEVLGLNVGDYEPSTGLLTVSRSLSEVGGLTTPKNGDVKKVTLMDQGQAALESHVKDKEPQEPMFMSRGMRITRHWLDARWHATCAKADIEGMRFHDLRHVSLTHIAHTGASLREIMARGGHRSVQAAMRYQAATSTRDHEIAKKASILLGG